MCAYGGISAAFLVSRIPWLGIKVGHAAPVDSKTDSLKDRLTGPLKAKENTTGEEKYR